MVEATTPAGEDRRREWWAAAACAAAVFACVLFSLTLLWEDGRVAALWPANAVMLAFALRGPPGRTPRILAVGWAADMAAALVTGGQPTAALALATVNILEVALCRRLLSRDGAHVFDVTRPRCLAALAGAAVVAAMASGLAASTALHLVRDAPLAASFAQWFSADALGLIVLTPVFLVLTPRRLARLWRPELRAGTAALAATVLAVLAVVFGQSSVPLAFLVPIVLILAAFYRGTVAVAAAMLATVLAGAAAAAFELGPTRLLVGAMSDRLLIQQLFVAVAAAASLPVAAELARRRRMERSLKSARAAAERSERRYRLIAEKATDVILHLDVEGRATFVSPGSAAVVGLAPGQLVGRSMMEIVHPDDLALVREAFRSLFDPNAPAVAVECRLRHADSRWIWIESRPRAVWGGDGRVTGFVDVLRDISARKAAEAELAEARRQAEAAAAAKSDFLATMSHELRTPLTSIIGFSGLLADSGRLGPGETRYVERIRIASDALLGIVNDVLDFSKLEAGAVELDPRPFTLDDLVAETVGLVAQQAEAKGLRLDAEVTPQGAKLVGDGPRLRQVLLNFLANAVKFTARGGVGVRAEVRPAGEGTARLRIAVRDTGIGVAQDKLDQLFERFVQADGSISRRFGGTGLGLAISRRLIDIMGGEIGVDSRPGEGSTFWFEVALPVAAETAERTSVSTAPLVGAGRVLMVDDNAANRELGRALLEAAGLEVDTAADGVEAVEAVKARAYALVLMDVHMPVMDGLDATRAIRSLGPRFAALPIVALTANVLPEHVARCREAGMDDHVGKPIIPAQLYAALGRWLADEAA